MKKIRNIQFLIFVIMIISLFLLLFNTFFEYNKIVSIVSVFVLMICIIIEFIINVIFIKENDKNINQINECLENMLCGVYDFDIKTTENSDIEKILNNVSKINLILNENKDLLMKNELMLEEIYLYLKNIVNDKNFENEIVKIEKMVFNCLKILNVDSGKVNLEYKTIKVSSFISKVLNDVKNIDVKLNIKNTSLYIDVDWTIGVITNIFEIFYKNNVNKILISSDSNSLYNEIRISTSEKIINEKDVSYILKKVIECQNGVFEVKTNENIGTIFNLRFNKNQEN